MNRLSSTLKEVRACKYCEEHLTHGPRPVLSAHQDSKVAIIGQAPGLKVHESGKPWDDLSGKQLRNWMNVSDTAFYDEKQFAIIPMGFCYPGKGKSGDLPPRSECAPLWHSLIMEKMNQLSTILLIGQYAQRYYLGKSMKRNLTETVKSYREYLPRYFVLPHPSPRNRFWLTKNPWFEKEVVPDLQSTLKSK